VSETSSHHVIKSYEQELHRLRDLIVEMGGLVENQIALATAAVLTQDPVAASSAVEQDPQVDALEREVEQFVIRLLALRQPVADDLRLIFACLKITDDLERIGDYAANIAKRTLALSQGTATISRSALAHMARLVQDGLKKVIDAFSENDAEKAIEVWRDDETIDDIYNAIFRELVTYMMEDPRNISSCAHLLFIAKNLERVGDHATNIAETVYYAVVGEPIADTRPKGDVSAYMTIRPPQ
jgi:phosphate transport system protein